MNTKATLKLAWQYKARNTQYFAMGRNRINMNTFAGKSITNRSVYVIQAEWREYRTIHVCSMVPSLLVNVCLIALTSLLNYLCFFCCFLFFNCLFFCSYNYIFHLSEDQIIACRLESIFSYMYTPWWYFCFAVKACCFI